MDNYLVEFDDEEIPNNEINPKNDYGISVVTKIEPKINPIQHDDILETYEDHMEHVHNLFTKLKKPESGTQQEKITMLTKLDNIKLKYPQVICQEVTINDNIETIQKVYNDFRLNVIKYLGKEVEKENNEVQILTKSMNGVFNMVISNLGMNKPSTSHNTISDLFTIINKSLQTDENELVTAEEFIKEQSLKTKLKKHKDIEEITSKIIDLKNVIKNNKGGCVWVEEQQVEKLTKKLNKILGIDTNDEEFKSDNESSEGYMDYKDPDDHTESESCEDDTDWNCQFSDDEKNN
jgi:hypothetical protein